jgi:hypothetical protein
MINGWARILEYNSDREIGTSGKNMTSSSGGGIGGGDREDLLTDSLAAARARSWCRQRRGTTVRQRALPALGRFGSKTRPQGHARHVISDATGDQRRDRSLAPSGQRRAAQAGLATRAAQIGHDFGRANERPRDSDSSVASGRGPGC